MKRTMLYTLIAATVLVTSCTKDFDDINTDPTRSNERNFDPNYLFTSAQVGYANISEYQLFEIAPMVQVLSSTLSSFGGGDKYNQFLFGYNTRFFTGTGPDLADGMPGMAFL